MSKGKVKYFLNLFYLRFGTTEDILFIPDTCMMIILTTQRIDLSYIIKG